MGPSLYEVWPCRGRYGRPSWSSNGAADDEVGADLACEPISSVTREGNPCGADDECWFIHSDMLHEAPQCTGIAHEPRAVTVGSVHDRSELRSGRVFWYLDGLHEELVRYDLSTGHGPGILDHRTANIRRYRDVQVEHSDDGVSHMVVHEGTRSLFIIRPRSGDVLRVNIDSGSFARVAQCVPDECYPAHDGYVPGTCTDGYCTGGACTHEDGFGCYHIFTETADIFEYEYWTCTQTEVFAAGLDTPAGIAVAGNLVFVSERGGTVRTYDLAGAPAGSFSVTQLGLAGLDAECEEGVCTVHFVNSETSELGRFGVLDAPGVPWAWPAFSCDAPEPDVAVPDFAVSHGPGYQSSMVIPFAYGKHCEGFAPGEDPGRVDLTTCPDREDCAAVNGDALLMAGYLCHPCLPNMCGLQACENIPGQGFACQDTSVTDDGALHDSSTSADLCLSACRGACFGVCFSQHDGCLQACESDCERHCTGSPEPTPEPEPACIEGANCPATPKCWLKKHRSRCPCACSCEEGPKCPAKPDCKRANHVEKCPCTCGLYLKPVRRLGSMVTSRVMDTVHI
jgi:hypothetical protein